MSQDNDNFENGVLSEPITIMEGEDFSDVKTPIVLTDTEFAYDIWLFGYDQNNRPFLRGIYRDGIVKLLSDWGYYKRYKQNNTYSFVREENIILDVVEPVNMKDCVYKYIQEKCEPIRFDYCGYKITVLPEKLNELFLRQSHTIFNTNFLEHLPNHIKPILRDDRTTAYFFFANRFIKVTAEGIEVLDYPQVSQSCIWREHISKHEFEYIQQNNDCHFAEFIKNVCNHEDDRYKALRSGIGYLMHNYADPSKGQAVIANDEEITDILKPMGGTGKGIIYQALSQVRKVVKVDGKKFDERDRFCFQDINETTQIVFFDDVQPKLGFDRFNSILTDGWNIEHKNKPSFYLKPSDSPKVYITSNFILESEGTTRERRQFVIEFSNFYSKYIQRKEAPIQTVHGCQFFSEVDWSRREWDCFFAFIMECAFFYLKSGLQYYAYRNIEKNRLRQTTSEEFAEWVISCGFQTAKVYDTQELFEDFKCTYYGEASDFKQRSFTCWIKYYAAFQNWDMKISRSNGAQKFSFKSLSR